MKLKKNHQLTIQEQKAIDEGIEDADSGELYSNLEASRQVRQWLNQ